jgi:hypothetical protein
MTQMDQIKSAQEKIKKLFLAVCNNGEQSKGLPNNCLSCGQYMGQEAKTINQRGLHGVAAAVRVLAYCDDRQCKETIKKLGNYVGKRTDIEKDKIQDAKLSGDELNVAKISELLYAFSAVRGNVGNVSELSEALSRRLLSSSSLEGGWPYFLDPGTRVSEAEVIPTSLAYLALSEYGASNEELNSTATYLKSYLKSQIQNKTTEISSDFFAGILCLYVLVTCKTSRDGHTSRDTLKLYKRALNH